MFPIFVNFKEGTKLTYGCVFYFPAQSVTPYAHSVKSLLGDDQDLGSISAALSGNQFFPIAKLWLLAGD